MLWLFGDSGKKVTRQEFRELVLPRLQERGLSNDDIHYVRSVLDAALNERGLQEGITKEEVDEFVKTVHENHPDFFSSENLRIVEEELRRKL